MPYLPSGLFVTVLLVAGLLLLAVVLVRLRGPVRRMNIARTRANARFADGTGLLRARVAALGVAVRERRQKHREDSCAKANDDARRVSSSQFGQTGGRP